jgi:hypothetical protein
VIRKIRDQFCIQFGEILKQIKPSLMEASKHPDEVKEI